jgi:hypothetical protein
MAKKIMIEEETIRRFEQYANRSSNHYLFGKNLNYSERLNLIFDKLDALREENKKLHELILKLSTVNRYAPR